VHTIYTLYIYYVHTTYTNILKYTNVYKWRAGNEKAACYSCEIWCEYRENTFYTENTFYKGDERGRLPATLVKARKEHILYREHIL
jgi:hypothetical protein